MELLDIEIRDIDAKFNRELNEAKFLLAKQNLTMDSDYTAGVFKDEKLIATGSLRGNTLRSIAVEPEYQGTGVINKLITHLVQKQHERGNHHLFIYTKPESSDSFTFFGFKEISHADNAILLENRCNGINKYCKKLTAPKGKNIATIVMNCNPFTLGHLYLIEKAAAENDVLHIFIVWENRSIFPADVRMKLVKEGTAHLKNVYIHKGEDYIISSATFPSYFLKEKSDAVQTHATLDIQLFAKHIAPNLGITRRYAGDEPFCPVTGVYNDVMAQILPKYNVEFKIIKRKKSANEIISASKVRQLIHDGKIEETKKFVPKTTYQYLISPQAEPIINKIKTNNARH